MAAALSPPARALARRALRDARTRTIAFAYLFALYAYIQPVGYRHTYSTPADRASFAQSFAGNKGLRLFYGEPHDLLTVSGYTAWRVGGTLAIVAAVFGLLAAVRALRTEEDTGRMELVLAAPVGRRTTFASAMAAIAAGIAILWLAELAGFVAGGLPAGGSAYLALATASVMAVFAGVGAMASQLAPTRRIALELGGAVVGLCFALRVVADTADGVGWLRWATPLGWAEELRPFSGARPLVLVLPVVATLLLIAAAARIAATRDIGTGMLPARDSADPRLTLLSSPTAQALRAERASLIVWTSGVAMFAFILGVVSQSVSSADIPAGARREIAKLGSGSIATPTGYLAFVFIFFILAVSLFACAQIGAARHEEADQQLETLLELRRRRHLRGSRGVHLGRGRLGRRQRLPPPDAGGGGQLPARRAAVPRARGARVRRRAPRERRGRLRARHRHLPVAARRLAPRRAEMARRSDAVRARRTRADAVVPPGGRGRDARHRRPERARGDRRLPAPGSARGVSRARAAENPYVRSWRHGDRTRADHHRPRRRPRGRALRAAHGARARRRLRGRL
jgi:polyether ionophore transport system permease protein